LEETKALLTKKAEEAAHFWDDEDDRLAMRDKGEDIAFHTRPGADMFSSKRHELDAFIARSQRANKVRELEMFLDEFKRKDDPKPTDTPKVRWELKAARSLPFRTLDTSRKFVGALHRG
jgi:hypothetical protein